MSMFNNFKIHCLCKMEKTLFVYVFSQFSIDKSAKSDYNIITASAKCAKLNKQKGDKKMYKNFRIYKTETGTYVLKADSKRFGKQAIIFEHYDCNAVVKYMLENYTNKDGKRIKNMRWTDLVYRKAMSTCNIPNNPWYTA